MPTVQDEAGRGNPEPVDRPLPTSQVASKAQSELASEPVVPIVLRNPLAPLPSATKSPPVTPSVVADAARTESKPTTPTAHETLELQAAAEELRRVNRTRQVVSLVSQMVIRAYEEGPLHSDVCRTLVQGGGYLMAWIGLAEETPERIVHPVAYAGFEPNFLKDMKLTWPNDLGPYSSTTRTVSQQRPHVARNIPTEARFAQLQSDAKLHGYTATCALPLQFASFGMGVLTIHATEPGAFGAEEVSLLRELATNLSAGVIALRERKARERVEERLTTVADAAADAIVGTNLNGEISEWNGGAARMFGYTREEAVGRRFEDLLASSVPPARRAAILEIVLRGEQSPASDVTCRRKDGNLIETSRTIAPIFAPDGRVVGATISNQDVTAQRATEAAKRAVEMEREAVARVTAIAELRRAFISQASHELNTPLTPLLLQVDLLRDDPDLSQKQRDSVAVIARNASRMSNLVKGMLETSVMLDTSPIDLETRDIRLDSLVEECIRSLEEEAGKASVTLESKATRNLVVHGDPSRVANVLHILLRNAISFTPKDGRVTVLATPEGKEARVCVNDTGLGLSTEHIAQLFQPFSKPHDGTGFAPNGSGLGLAYAKGTISLHGGRIWAESKGLGQGSSFCFTLPLSAAPGVKAAAASS